MFLVRAQTFVRNEFVRLRPTRTGCARVHVAQVNKNTHTQKKGPPTSVTVAAGQHRQQEARQQQQQQQRQRHAPATIGRPGRPPTPPTHSVLCRRSDVFTAAARGMRFRCTEAVVNGLQIAAATV